MLEINSDILMIIGLCAGLFVGLQLVLTIGMLISLRSASRERTVLAKELFGLVRKLEGLTSNRREQMLKHYDSLLDSLSARLPPTIAAQTSQIIVETESKILARLAELEPNLKDDHGRKKMDDLIKSMENLEHTIVVLAADTVRRVMAEGRRTILEDDGKFSDLSIAA
ncbi:MAG: hypothetical protein DCC75_01340 [Proteobacteria bacterium]|nr:MAG: hypothetical protein DCC75_01340 [Pseudomonadota bacterium]